MFAGETLQQDVQPHLDGFDGRRQHFTLMALIEEGNTLLLVSRRVPSMSKASRRMSLLHSACRLPEKPAGEKESVRFSAGAS